MKSDKKIFIAFLLNLIFSILEFIGGFFTNSVAIMSDAVHDLGDAISIGFSYFLEKKSNKAPDEHFTYGYRRYSIVGAAFTSIILLFGSLLVVAQSVYRLLNPTFINYNGMLFFGIIGVTVNIIATYITKEGDSLNQKAVNLHMIEDVLGWIVVLVGALIIKFTDFSIIDPIMSICVAAYICFNSIINIKEVLSIFLEKTPENIDINNIKNHLLNIEGVVDVHHLHIWRLNENVSCATLHIVIKDVSPVFIKEKARQILEWNHIYHTTVEIEGADEVCIHKSCCVYKEKKENTCLHHHHHHH